MKKRLLLLGMIVCLMFGLTACGNETSSVMTDEETMAVEMSDYFLQTIGQIVDGGMADQYIAQYEELAPIFENWSAGMADIGEIASIDNHTVKFDGKEVIINTEVTGTVLDPDGNARKADIEQIYLAKDYTPVSLSVNVRYTFAELMEKAGLNTLLGMGTVFCILILISLIISLFGLIPKIQAAFAKKESKAAETETAVDNTIAQIIENEELSDDTEIIAVISAAIAAYEAENGYVSADGVVIRSIRKVNKSKWQNA